MLPVQDKAVWVPAQTMTSVSGNNTTVNLVAAVLKSTKPSSVKAVFYVSTPQIGTLNPKIATQTSSTFSDPYCCMLIPSGSQI